MTVVQLTVRDAARLPRRGVHGRVRLLTVPGYLLDDSEIIRPAEDHSDAAGLLAFDLVPSSQVTAPDALYELAYAGRRVTFTVPDSGTYDLVDLLRPVLPGNIEGGSFTWPGTASFDDGTFSMLGTAFLDDGSF